MRRNDFYVYLHKKKSDGKVFYVGKGKGKRAFDVIGRSDYWKRIVKKHGLEVEIAIFGVQEWYAFEFERELICYYGRDSLCNLTDGGDGSAGFVPSPETKKKIAMVWLGRNHSCSSKEKISSSNKGRIFSDEHRNKLSLAAKKQAERSSKSRPVRCGNGLEFTSVAKAIDWLKSVGFEKASEGSIRGCESGRRKHAYGFTWTFL